MNRKNSRQKNLETTAITLSVLGGITISLAVLIGVPSIILLFFALIGDRSVTAEALLVIFLAPLLLLSIILGVITYVIYHKNRHYLSATTKKISLLALFSPIVSTILMLLSIL